MPLPPPGQGRDAPPGCLVRMEIPGILPLHTWFGQELTPIPHSDRPHAA